MTSGNKNLVYLSGKDKESFRMYKFYHSNTNRDRIRRLIAPDDFSLPK